jgi:transcriptional adapter 2-alpha
MTYVFVRSAIGELMEKSAEECKQHYEQFYVRDPLPQMPSLLLPKCCMKKRVVPAYNESLVWEGNPNIKDRPHPVSFGLEGYLPFRGDFSKEWCDKAEEMVANVCGFEQENHSEEDSVITDLKLAVIDRYRLILKQRLCRKRLIRDYGILATNRAGLEDKLVLRKWRLNHRMCRFMRLVPPRDYDSLLQGLYMQMEVETHVKKLQNYRRCGIKQKHAAAVYNRITSLLAKDRESFLKLHLAKMSVHISEQIGLYKGPSSKSHGSGSSEAVASYQGDSAYSYLDDEERKFCHTHLILPAQFLKHKRCLVDECSKKDGQLSLHDARKILRIDVNKTRKIYDFLATKQLINLTTSN